MDAPVSACVFGCSGLTLTAEERAFFRTIRPVGFILFRRNIETPDQVRALISDLKACVDFPTLVMLDQEGGRVRRLRPPQWPDYPAAARYGQIIHDLSEAREWARAGARLMAHDLMELGFNVDCAPVLDVSLPGGHDIVGDRAYGTTPQNVAVMGRAACEGLLAGGVLPVIKHIPGHGRGFADSHAQLPVVDTPLEALIATDFHPFQVNADMPMAMTAHVLFTAIDAENPATTSKACVRVIREVIGFDGVLITDDLSMNALSGTLPERARAALRAGCDIVLHCSGVMEEMTAVAAEISPLEGDARRRVDAALKRILDVPEPLNVAEARAAFDLAMARPVGEAIDPTEAFGAVLGGQGHEP